MSCIFEALRKRNFVTAKNPFLNRCSFITKVKPRTQGLSLSFLILPLVIVSPCSFNEGLYFTNHKRAAEASTWPSFLICLVPLKTVSHYEFRAKRVLCPVLPSNPIIRSMATLTLSALSYFSFESIEHRNLR